MANYSSWHVMSMPMAASFNSKPTSSYQSQPGYSTTAQLCSLLNSNAGLWCTYGKTGSLATRVSCVVTFTCPTWTFKRGNCQYPYSHQPFIKHAKDQWPIAVKQAFISPDTPIQPVHITHVAHIVNYLLVLGCTLAPTFHTVVPLPHTTCTCICTGSIYIIVAVTCRNRRLFRHAFWSHCCVWSAVLLNFRSGRGS